MKTTCRRLMGRVVAVVACMAGASGALAEEGWYHAWTRELPERQAAWQWNKSLPQDRQYRMVEAGDVVIVGTTADQSLRAINKKDGSERWRFYFDGAIRWQPAVVGDAVVAGSDDGTIACVGLADGKLRWRYRPGPDSRQMIGHLRMQSSWPIMTSVGTDGKNVYGACGLFEDDGIWVFGVDAKDGSERWLKRIEPRVSGRVLVSDGKVGFQGLGVDVGTSALVFDGESGARFMVEDPKGKGGKVAGSIRVGGVREVGPPRLVKKDGVFVAGSAPVSLDVAAAIAGGAAQEVALPKEWRRYGPFTASETVDIARVPASGAMKVDGESVAEEKLAAGEDGVINLLTAYGDVSKVPGFKAPLGAEMVLTGTVKTERAGTLVINASADWYVQVAVDGRSVIDVLQAGNGMKVTEPTAQTGTAAVEAGEHAITLRVRPGKDGWNVRLRAGLAKDDAAVAGFAGRGRTGAVPDPVSPKGVAVQAVEDGESLVILTANHQMHGFVRRAVGEAKKYMEPVQLPKPPKPIAEDVRAAIGSGWVLLAGADGISAVDLALGTSASHIVVADASAEGVAAARKQVDAAGVTRGGRVQVVQVDPASEDLPPWVFSYVVCGRGVSPEKLTRLLHPHGGTLVLPQGADADAVAKSAKDLSVVTVDRRPAVRRAGAIADTRDWTHELATPGNESGLPEPLVKFPLAVHWFSGPTDAVDNFLVPAGGAASQEGTVMQPVEQLVVRGMWLLQGIGRVTAYDGYTGRQLWQHPLPTWNAFEGMNAKVAEDPIANRFPVTPTDMCRTGGFNWGCNSTSLYIAVAREMRVYDLATGKVKGTWKTPEKFGDVRWGTVRATDGAIIATLFRPQDLKDALIGWDGNGGAYVKDRQRMRHLVCLDPETGAVRWAIEPARGFINHGVAMGKDKVFALDLIEGNVINGMAQKGVAIPANAGEGELLGISLADGKVAWRKDLLALLTDIVYQPESDMVLLPSRQGWTLKDNKWVAAAVAAGAESKKKGKNANAGILIGVRGADGKEVYQRDSLTYFEPYSVVEKRVVQRYGIELATMTGEELSREHPVTGALATFNVPAGGCTWLIQSLNFSANRHGWTDMAAALSGDFGGIDGGCTPVHLPAGGLVNINNVSIARFANRSKSMSRALVHRDRVTAWANDHGVTGMKAPSAVVKKLGILPGAPGNRSVEGTWWVRMGADGLTPLGARAKPGAEAAQGVYEIAEHRFVGAKVPGVPEWVGAWGLVGLVAMQVPTVVPSGSLMQKATFKVTVIVTEPEMTVGAGKRVFDIAVDGKVIAGAVDPVKLAGGPRKGAAVTAEVEAKGAVMTVTCKPAEGSLPAVIGGIYVERVERQAE